MTTFLERVDERYGSIEGYVDSLGVDDATVDRLRSHLVG